MHYSLHASILSRVVFLVLSFISLVYFFLLLSSPQMLSFMHAQYSLFQQGFKLLDEIDPYMKKLAAEVTDAHVLA